MGTPSNMGWPTDFVPSADEWAQSQSAKVDYPAPVAQGGTGALSALAANYNLSQRSLIGSDVPALLSPLTAYGLQTSVAALSLNLPPLASVSDGDWIALGDVDFNAATNNVTVNANGSDQITFEGVPASSQAIVVSGAQVWLIVNAGTWSMIIASPYNPASGFAPLNSPHFTGIPTAPTALLGTASTQIATTAFVASSGPVVSAATKGAKGDLVQVVASAAISAASNTLTVTGGTFTAGDEGKYITVYGAGAGGVSLYTTIAAWISSTQVTLVAAAATAVTFATIIYGTGNAIPFANTIATAKALGIDAFIPGPTTGTGYYLEDTVYNTGVTIAWAGPHALVWRQGLGYAFTNPFTLPTRDGYFLTNSPINSTVLTFADPTDTAFFKVDAYALIGSTAAYDRPILDPQRRGEYVRIKAIDSGAGTVTLYDALMDDYLIADAPQLIPVTLTENVRYRNPSIKMDITVPVVGGGDPNSELRNAIQTMYALRPRIDGARIQWAVGAGLSFEGCIGWMVSDYEAHDLGSAVNSDGTNPNGLGGYGYAIIERGLNFGGVAWGMYHERVRHGYTCGGSYIFTLGRPVGATIAFGTVWGGEVSGWDTHEIGFGITFVSLKSFGAQGPGFTIRCDSVKLSDIGAYFCLGAIIAYFQGATENAQNCVADGVYGIGNNWGTDAQGNIWTGQPTIFDSGTNNTTTNVVVDSAYGPLFAAEANSVNPTFKNFKAKNLNLSGANYAIYLRSINALVAIGSANITSVSNVGSLYVGMAVDPSITGLTTSTVGSVNVGAATAVLSDPSILAGVHTISPNGIVRIRDGDIDCSNGMITDLVRGDTVNAASVPQISNVIPFGVFSGLWYNAINQATNQLVNWTGPGLLGVRTAVTLNGSTDLPLAGLTHFRFSVSKTTAETLVTASGRALEGAFLDIAGGTTGIVVTNNNIATPDTFVCMGNTNLSLTTSEQAMFVRTGVQWVQVPTV